MNPPNGHAFVWFATLLPAGVIALVPGAPAELRQVFGFELQPASPTMENLVGVLSTNLRVLATLGLATIAAHLVPALQRAADAIVYGALSLNCALVGAALGAYGREALPYLSHLPLEWLAFGTAAQSHARARGAALSARRTLTSWAACAVTLMLAGVVEVFSAVPTPS